MGFWKKKICFQLPGGEWKQAFHGVTENGPFWKRFTGSHTLSCFLWHVIFQRECSSYFVSIEYKITFVILSVLCTVRLSFNHLTQRCHWKHGINYLHKMSQNWLTAAFCLIDFSYLENTQSTKDVKHLKSKNKHQCHNSTRKISVFLGRAWFYFSCLFS